MKHIIHCKNFNEMSSEAADFITIEMLSAKKQYSLALPGGNSVTGVLNELAGKKIVWPAVNAFMADERLAPITDALSNYMQANGLLFSKVQGIHAFPFEMEKGVADYEKKFMAVTKGALDMVVLGVGEDGHIASLFPNHEALNENKTGYLEIHNAPKPPSNRISLSPKAIEGAGTAILLFASGGRRGAFEKFVDNGIGALDCPAKIALKAKKCIVFTAFGGKDAE